GFRIYAAWEEHLQQYGSEPTAEQLSQHLADSGTSGKPYSAEKIAEIVGGFPLGAPPSVWGGRSPLVCEQGVCSEHSQV
ncbi:hypothetical protein, partial [Streptomyces sp. NPDC096153]|uniref:hypothetical protein n=1 Tax=Streptomyces sp. NPDC096153 TaxID=3155548 RepID=UPI003317ED56